MMTLEAQRRHVLAAILRRSTGKYLRIHGPAHWAEVAAAGLSLLGRTGADPLTVALFAAYHDAMRHSDLWDPYHGERATYLARAMNAAGDLELDGARLALLELALSAHDWGQTSQDPTVGTCWDADRLSLRRRGHSAGPRHALHRGGQVHSQGAEPQPVRLWALPVAGPLPVLRSEDRGGDTEADGNAHE